MELQSQIIRVKGPSPDYEAAFSAMDHEPAQALVVLEEPINAACRKQIAELACVRRLATVFAREQVDAGGLIAYGMSIREAAKTHGSLCRQDPLAAWLSLWDLTVSYRLRQNLSQIRAQHFPKLGNDQSFRFRF